MKKRIAVLANGWNSENLSNFMMGITEAVEKESMDFFVFLSYASYGFTEDARISEGLIYDLPDLSSFDGIIIFGPGLNFQDVIDRIQKYADEAGVPVISIGLKHKGHYYIGAGNYVGMRELTDHMIDVHHAKNLLFIAGSKENDDSNERLKAIKDSCEAHGVPFGEKNVVYSNWERGVAIDYIRNNYETPDKFPDAFLCANDQLAIIVNQSMESEYHLDPRSVKITGFDYLDQGKNFFPSITTVDQRYDAIGVKAAKLFENLFKGKKVPEETIVECKFELGESCGCGYSRKAMRNRRAHIRKMQQDTYMTISREGRLFVMERCISQAQSYKGAKKNLQDLLYNSYGSEGDTFYITFAPMLENVGEIEDSKLPIQTLDKEYLVVAGKKDNKPIADIEKVDRKMIVPGYDGEGENKIYQITMLRNENIICGYFIMGREAKNMRGTDMYDFQGRLDRSFFTYIRNLQLSTLNKKLADLMEQDVLTHVKNRTAYDKYLNSFKEKLDTGEVKEFAVAYFDINNLKVINDKYGHEAGDAYIRNSCKLICDTFKHSPVFRIGGDEFLSFIINEDYENRDALLEGMKKDMAKREKNPTKYPPASRVSIATGIAVYDSKTDKDIMSVVNHADVLMYEEKFKMKNGNVR